MKRTGLVDHTGEASERVDRGLGREGVDAAQALACADVAGAVGSGARDDGGGRGSASSDSASAARGGSAGTSISLDGNGTRGGCSRRVHGLNVGLLEGSAVLLDGELLELSHGLVALEFSVDGEDHADSAVNAVLLLAVEPERIGGRNSDVPSDTRLALWVGHEPRVHASLHLLARVGKRRLRSGVILLEELEHDHVANVRCDRFGEES